MDQGGFFTADERAGAEANVDLEAEIAAQNVFAQQTCRAGLGQGGFQTVDRQRIFRADVDIPLAGADGVSGQTHAFDDAVRIAFHDRAIHERARVAFIGVADNKFLRAGIAFREGPFLPGGETCAAAAAQAGSFHRVDDILGRHLGQGFADGLVTAIGDIFFDFFRIDQTAIAQRNPFLEPIKRNFIGGGDPFFLLGVFVKQALHLLTLEQVLRKNLRHVFGFNFHVKGVVGENLDDRAFFAEPETTGN